MCETGISESGDLTKHKQSLTGANLFQCELCENGFTEIDYT